MYGVFVLQGAIIANPNCSTIIALMAVTPLHKVANVKRMIVSTYQVRGGDRRARGRGGGACSRCLCS